MEGRPVVMDLLALGLPRDLSERFVRANTL
jgi:hypothetical protein